jgi:hypothetical protein
MAGNGLPARSGYVARVHLTQSRAAARAAARTRAARARRGAARQLRAARAADYSR